MDNSSIFFRIIVDYGYLALFIALIIEGTGMPGPVELFFLAAGYLISKGQMNFTSVILVAAAGNVTGNAIAYMIGAKKGRAFVERYGKYLKISVKDLEGMDKWFSKYGGLTVFLGRIIGLPRTPAIWASGISKMNFKVYFIYSALADLIWSAFWTSVAYLAAYQMLKINLFGKEYPIWYYFATTIAFMLFLYIIWRLFLWMKERYLT
ncbi:DedA family protein [Aceticella autotrophica]|uniref:DedA family protein n=1 Tax=Aceticella autotrophica TaxID=2755338 RepID=A0A975AWF8_9THEO|nr:DedA family protein [Aceticella autotrophica]QSZ27720.1 DedA family protein [Aceticella autotrophica]